MRNRWEWLVASLALAGCGRESGPAEPGGPVDVAGDGRAESDAVNGVPSAIRAILEARREAALEGELELEDLSERDRALLAEYAAIRARHTATADARPVEAVAPADTGEPIEGALFGLRTRDHCLWLLGGRAGERYRVTTRDGEVLAESLDEDALARDFPALHALLQEPLIDVHAIDY